MSYKITTRVLFFIFVFLNLQGIVWAENIRQFTKPEWLRDVTNLIVRSDGKTMQEVLDRDRRSAEEDAGRLFFASLSIPEDLPKSKYGYVLDFDLGTHIKDFNVNGVERRGIWRSGYWDGDEFTFALSSVPKQNVSFSYRAFTNLYPNSFGRAIVRPASLADAVRLEKIDEQIKNLRVSNNLDLELKANLQVRYTDYFGTPLKEETLPIALKAFGASVVSLNEPAKYWRAEIVVCDAEEKGLPHWHYQDASVFNLARPEVEVLRDAWKSAAGGASREVVPEDKRFQPASFPLLYNSRWKEKSHYLWLKRSLSVPADWAGKKIALYFPVIRYRADIYINGKNIGAKSVRQTPDWIDLSPHIKAGETAELMICLTDFTASMKDGLAQPSPDAKNIPDRAFIESVDISVKGMKASLPVAPELLALPETRIENAAIRTFLEGGKRLQLIYELCNDSGNSGAYKLFPQIKQKGIELKKLPSQNVEFSKGEKHKTISLEVPWEDAKLWSPDTPELYELQTKLSLGDEKIEDLRRDRFGFREIKIVGRHYTLNGKPFQASGFSTMGVRCVLWPVTPYSFNMGRHNLQGADVTAYGISEMHRADEIGFTLKTENGLHCGFGQVRFAYQDERFWRNMREHISNLIKVSGNHPSVLIWDLGNENYFPLAGEAERIGKFMGEIKQIDPTRPVHIGGSVSLPQGKDVQVIDIHGFGEPTRRTYFFMNPEKRPAYMKCNGIYSYMPAGENPKFWQEAKSWDYMLDPNIPYARHIAGKVMFFGESLYNHADSFPGLSGENLFYPFERDNARIHKFHYPQKSDMNRLKTMLVRKYQIRFMREAEPAGFLGHVGRGITSSIASLAAFPDPSWQRFQAGEQLKIPFNIYNNTSLERKASLILRLQENGKTIAEQKLELELPVGARVQKTVDFGVLPIDGKDRRIDLITDMSCDNGAWFQDWNELVIFAKDDFSVQTNCKLSVYDPSEVMASFLKKRGADFVQIKNLSDWNAGKNEILLAGTDSISSQKDATALAKKLEANGGRIIVLDHKKIPQLAKFRLENGIEEFFIYPLKQRVTTYFDGLTEQDLRFWKTLDNDFKVSRNTVQIPTQGNFRVGGMGGKGTKASTTPLLEVFVGKGSVVFAQFNFARAIETEPAAQRLLANLLRSKVTFEPKKVVALGKQDFINALETRTGYSGALISKVCELTAEIKILLLDGRVTLDEESIAHLKSWIEQGGICWLSELDQKTSSLVTALSDSSCVLKAKVSDRANVISDDNLIAGINSGEFFWIPRKSGVDLYLPAPRDNLKPEPTHPVYQELLWADAKPLLSPNALAVMNKGKGRIVVSTLRLRDTSSFESNFVWSTLLTNLGVPLEFKLGAKKNELNARLWKYTPIDIKKFCNRALKAEESSRVLAWSAEGKAKDMSEFPVGTRRFGGIHFDVIAPEANQRRSVLALSNAKDSSLPSEQKDILVKNKFKRVAFLYSASGAPDVTFRIWYAERKTWIPGAPQPYEDVKLYANEDIADWYEANDYINRQKIMPKARLAWTGNTQHSRSVGRKVAVFLYEWDNPHPEKEIDSIDIISSGDDKAQFFLLGISGANPIKKRSWRELAFVTSGDWKLCLAEKGCVTRIVNTENNKSLMRMPVWVVQGMERHSRGVKFLSLGTQDEADMRIKSENNAIHISGELPILKFSTTISAIPDGFRFCYEFKITQALDKNLSPALRIPFQAMGGKLVNTIKPNPLVWEWQNGSKVSVCFPEEWNNFSTMYRKGTFVPFLNREMKAGAEAKFSIDVKFSK